MKCQDVKHLLSEYIDNMLNKENASWIREHLAQCLGCEKEYEDLMKVVGHMHQIETLETPDYFLQKVKKHLVKPSSLERIKKRLFYPLRIKLPFELAGVVVILFCVVYFAGFFERPHLYDLALSMKTLDTTESQEKKFGRRDKLEAADKEKRREREGTFEEEKKRAEDLREVVHSLSGKIIKSENFKDTNILKSFVVEIPADAYPKLFKELERLGEIQKPYPVIEEKGSEVVRVRIAAN